MLLQSWRREADGSYVLASRSVELDDVPEQQEYHRGMVLPSGWFLHAAEGKGEGSTRLHYLLQALTWHAHLDTFLHSIASTVCTPLCSLLSSPCSLFTPQINPGRFGVAPAEHNDLAKKLAVLLLQVR